MPATTMSASDKGDSAYMDSIVSLDEVSVSSIKATSASAFPSASTNLNLQRIEKYDISGVKGVSEIAPNFYMPQYGSRMTSSIYVRGLGTRIDQPVVALNVDNVSIVNKDGYDFNFPDLDRIEVVRGAQSILYGRNSMGGVINLSTISPLAYQGVRALVQYGSANTWRASVSAYTKPSDCFGVGVIASMNATDGFFRNEYNGKKVDSEKQGLAKLKLSWRPSQSFILENSAWTTITRQGGYPYESLETGQINHNDTCFYRRFSVTDGLTMRYIGNDFSVSSITGFHYLKDNMTLDQDFLPQDYFTLTQRRHEWSLTQDFVAKGKKGAYDYLAGAYGFYRRYNMSAPVTFKDFGISSLIEHNINSKLPQGMQLKWDERNMVLGSDFVSPSWGWALYTKHEYAVGRLTASLGLRLAFERTSLDYVSEVKASATMYRQAGPNLIPLMSMPVDTTLVGNPHMTSLQLLPELKLAYKLGDNMSIGAVVAKGSKSGGYNTQMFSDILQQAMMSKGSPRPGASAPYIADEVISYKPETSWNYELNFLASIPAASLDLTFSTFYIDCRNQQMTVFPEGSTTGRMMTNAGKTRSAGIEVSAAWHPVETLVLNASYGLADARFRRYDNGLVDCKGNHVPYAPENTLFASATYTLNVNSSFIKSVAPTLTCRGVGNIYWDEENSVKQPFYAQLGASVNIVTKVFDLEIWGENLTDTRYATFYFESIGNRFVQRGNPISIGATLRMNFDFK